MPRRTQTPERLLATVLFTDIVGSTELASKLGDKNWRQLVGRHHAFVRKTLKQYGGREVDTSGDGFFATFDQPAKAIRCAVDLTQGLARLGVPIRAGIHMGEVEIIGPKVGGIAVHIGARVMAKAGAGEVLVSSTVRDLMAGSDIQFEDQGLQELKGVPAQWHLYAIEHEAPEARPDFAIPALQPEQVIRRGVSPLVLGVTAFVVVALVLGGVLVLRRGGGGGGLAAPRPNTVARIDPKTDKVMGAIPVGRTPLSIASGGGALWVANFDDQTYQRIDPHTNDTGAAAGLPVAPTGLAVGGGFVWMTAHFSGALYKIDPTQPHASKPVNLGVGVSGVAFGDGSVWVTNTDDNTLLKVDPETLQVVATISDALDPGSEPEGIAVSPGAIWVGESLKGKVVAIDPRTGKKLGETLLLHGNPSQLAYGEGFVWVTDTNDDSVTRIDPRTQQGTTISNVGNGPVGVAAGDGAAWVANSLDGTLAKIDPQTARVIGRIKLVISPEGVAVTDGAVWVTIHALTG